MMEEEITLNAEDLKALNIRRNRIMEFFKKSKDEGRSIEHTYDLFASGYLLCSIVRCMSNRAMFHLYNQSKGYCSFINKL